MIIDEMVEAAVTEFKKKLVDYCEKPSEEDLTTTSVEEITQGIQVASGAASRAAFCTFLETKEKRRDIVRFNGEAYRFKYASPKTFLSLWGPVKIRRRLFQNASDKSHVPLDAAWGMVGEHVVVEVQEAIGFACAHVTPEEAAGLFEKSALFHPHPTVIKRALERIEERVSARRAELEQGIREQESAPEGTRVLVASMDGVNVLLNEKGKKMGRPTERAKGKEQKETKTSYKNAMVGSFSLYGEVKEGEKCPQRLGCCYAAHMPEDCAVTFKSKFEAELDAAEIMCPATVKKIMLCDGARAIWKYLEGNERFDDYEKLIDFFHSVEHLSLAAEALFGKGTDEADAWYGQYAKKLLEEDKGAQSILNSIDYHAKVRKLPKSRRKDLATQRTFYRRNKGKMNYADFRRRGIPVGSGPVEAACKNLVKTRMCRSGMRWTREGGQRILDLRCYVKSNRWDAFWDEYKKLRAAA